MKKKWWMGKVAYQIWPKSFADSNDDGHFSSKFDFSPELCGKNGRWDLNEDVTAEMYKNVIFDSQLRTGEIGFLSNIIENHDEPRGVSRYIPVEDLSEQINVKKQQAQPDSVWNFYKQMIAVYKNPAYHETLTFGKFEPYAREQKNLIAYYRKGETQTLLVLVNFQKEPQRVALPTGEAKVVLDNTASALQGISVKESEIILDGYQAVVLEVM